MTIQGPMTVENPGTHALSLTLDEDRLLRYTLFVPSTYSGEDEVPLVVSLHYGGEVTPFYGRDLLETLMVPGLGDLGAIMVAPDSLGRGWSSSGNEEALLTLIDELTRTYSIDSRRVLLAGFSMGGRGTWAIGGRNQGLFTAAIAIAASPDGEAQWEIPLCVLHSREDEVFPFEGTRIRVEELRSKGAPIEFRELQGLTHHEIEEYVEPLRGSLPWLREAWD